MFDWVLDIPLLSDQKFWLKKANFRVHVTDVFRTLWNMFDRFFFENIFEKKSSEMFDIVLNNILNVNMQEYNQKFIIRKQRRS